MKLIITDLDNTLLRSDKSISEYTSRIFERVREKGHLVAFATARGYAIARFVDLIKPDVLITNGGATVCVDGKIIYRNLMPGSDVEKIIQMCQRFKNDGAQITIENDDGYYCNFEPADPDRRSVYTYSDFKDFRAPAYKVSPILERDEWANAIAQACPNCSLMSFREEKWRRFAAANSNKESALRILVQYLGIHLKDVIAFGDDLNDVEMLKIAGTSVAVGNAIKEVKAVANYVTDCNDNDGVASWIKRFVLNDSICD